MSIQTDLFHIENGECVQINTSRAHVLNLQMSVLYSSHALIIRDGGKTRLKYIFSLLLIYSTSYPTISF